MESLEKLLASLEAGIVAAERRNEELAEEIRLTNVLLEKEDND